MQQVIIRLEKVDTEYKSDEIGMAYLAKQAHIK